MHDMLTIQYYLDLENYAESTEKAKNYMMEQVVMFIAYLIIRPIGQNVLIETAPSP